jgi:hypothetical protein
VHTKVQSPFFRKIPRKANKPTRLAAEPQVAQVIPPHNAQKGKNQADHLLWEVCARQTNERRVIVVPTMTAADPGAEFSQKWIISGYLLGWGGLLGSKKMNRHLW